MWDMKIGTKSGCLFQKSNAGGSSCLGVQGFFSSVPYIENVSPTGRVPEISSLVSDMLHVESRHEIGTQRNGGSSGAVGGRSKSERRWSSDQGQGGGV